MRTYEGFTFSYETFCYSMEPSKGFRRISVPRRRAFERFHTTEESLFKYLEPLERYFKSA